MTTPSRHAGLRSASFVLSLLLAAGPLAACTVGAAPGSGGGSSSGSGSSSGIIGGSSSGASGGSSGSSPDGGGGGSSGGGGTSDGGGGACPGGQPLCGADCCDSGSTCIDDGTGTQVCAQSCSTSNDCPAAKGCCTFLEDSSGNPLSVGACLPNGTANGQQCLCGSAAECSSSTCGPVVDTSGEPQPYYVCKANDGVAYDGCSSGSCGSGLCCLSMTSSTGSLGDICERPCQTSASCGDSTCQPLTSGTCAGLNGSCMPN